MDTLSAQSRVFTTNCHANTLNIYKKVLSQDANFIWPYISTIPAFQNGRKNYKMYIYYYFYHCSIDTFDNQVHIF